MPLRDSTERIYPPLQRGSKCRRIPGRVSANQSLRRIPSHDFRSTGNVQTGFMIYADSKIQHFVKFSPLPVPHHYVYIYITVLFTKWVQALQHNTDPSCCKGSMPHLHLLEAMVTFGRFHPVISVSLPFSNNNPLINKFWRFPHTNVYTVYIYIIIYVHRYTCISIYIYTLYYII